MLGGQGLELPDDLDVTAEGDLRIQTILDRGQTSLFQSSHDRLEVRQGRDVREHLAPPQGECPLQGRQGRGNPPRLQFPPALTGQLLEAVGIDLPRRDLQYIATRAGAQIGMAATRC